MTDQDTLNKLFDAALKEPEKPKPEKPKFAPGPVGGANTAGAAAASPAAPAAKETFTPVRCSEPMRSSA